LDRQADHISAAGSGSGIAVACSWLRPVDLHVSPSHAAHDCGPAAVNRPGPDGIARPGWLATGQQLSNQFVRPNGEFGSIVAEVGAVFGRLTYGRPVGLLLVCDPGDVDGIAGVLDAVQDRLPNGQIRALRLTGAREIDTP
jgi:hypothetical protein